MNDPDMAPQEPPRQRPRGRSRPATIRLPVVIPIREAKHLKAAFPEAVCDVLAAVGIGADHIVDERSKMSEIAFGRTNNRSLLGR